MKADLRKAIYKRIAAILDNDIETEGFNELLDVLAGSEKEARQAVDYMHKQAARYHALANVEDGK